MDEAVVAVSDAVVLPPMEEPILDDVENEEFEEDEDEPLDNGPGNEPTTSKKPEGQQRQGCPDTEAQIINHLLFHKAIIKEPDEKVVDVDTYLGILKELDEGMHVVLDNPVDRAVAIAFQLVIDERFDPWNLDLEEFTKMYLKKIRTEEDVNFIIAGRLILMAWNILKCQSEHLLIEADKIDEPTDFYFDGWEPYDWGDQQQGVNYGQLILDGQQAPLTEAVRSNDVRAVTLMSLVAAFDEAREEIALQERIRRFAKADLRIPVNISDKLHQESLQEDISITWQRICKFDDATIPITNLWDEDNVYDKVTVFVSTLFLANMNKVKLTQRKFPFGEIMIKNIEDEDMPPETEKAEGQEPEPKTEGTEQEAETTEIPEIIPEEIQNAEPQPEEVATAKDLAVV
jgi:segregation and condensation protein A